LNETERRAPQVAETKFGLDESCQQPQSWTSRVSLGINLIFDICSCSTVVLSAFKIIKPSVNNSYLQFPSQRVSRLFVHIPSLRSENDRLCSCHGFLLFCFFEVKYSDTHNRVGNSLPCKKVHSVILKEAVNDKLTTLS
jgi:hypothetical protein